MAQDLLINGKEYPGVSKLTIPSISGGSEDAVFVDTSGATTISSDITKDKIVYVDGKEIIGTGPIKPYIDSSKMKSFAHIFSNGMADLSLLDNIDTSNGTLFDYMFWKNSDLIDLSLETSNGTSFQFFCSGSPNLKNVTKLDVSNATTTFAMFHLCYHLTTVPELNTVNNKDFRSMFYSCDQNLTTIPLINLSNGEKYLNMFFNCRKLSSITFVGTINIKSNDLNLSPCPLDNATLDNIVNALSDNSGLETTYTVTLGSTNLAKLTEEQLAIVAAKNINLA